MKTVVQFGAGNIGRGFLGQLYSQSSWKTIYIDVVPEVVDKLQKENTFNIYIVGSGEKTIKVENVEAVNGKDIDAVADAIADADMLGTSVGVNALPFIVPALCKGLEKRAAKGAGIDMIICENLLDSSKFLREKILEKISPEAKDFVENKLGLVETVVSRMIPVIPEEKKKNDPLSVWVEAYGILPVAQKGFKNGIPEIKGFEPIADIHAYEERKLFCHNCMHCMASYFGFQKGYTYVYEAIEDESIKEKVCSGGWEAGRALIKKHGFTEEDYKAHIEDLLFRFTNHALGDTVARCGGDPVRKLGRRDRLIGAALAAIEGGEKPDNIIDAILAGMKFNPKGDKSVPVIQEKIKAGGIGQVLKDISGLQEDETLYKMIMEKSNE